MKKSKFTQYKGLPRTVYILALGKLINCIGAFIMPLMSLILIQKIGLTVTEAGFLISFAAIIQMPFMILGGKLVDTIGPKKVIVIFQSIAALLFIICAFVPTNRILICLLIAQSCFSALSTSCFEAIVGNITNAETRKPSFSLIYMGLNLGYAIGPAVGALMFEKHLSWLFIGDGITTLICVLLIAIFVKKSEYEDVIIERPNLEEKVEGTTIRVLFERPALIIFMCVNFLVHFVYAQFNFTMPIQINEVFGSVDGPILFGLLCSLNGFVVIMCTPILTAITRNIKITNAMTMGIFLYCIFFGVCGFSSMKWQFICIVIAITIGEILLAINSGTYVANLTPTSHRGRIISIIPIVTGLGYSLSSSVMGILITEIGMQKSWIIVSLVGIVAMIMMYSLKFIPTKIKHTI